jgi:DNA repair and recombination protein RAD54B
VYQRQIMKSDLASATMVSGSSAAGLSQNELKQLFSLELGAECATKQLLQSCNAGEGVVWLTLPSADGAAGDSSSGDGSIPSALAAAVAAGCVTAINRELQPGDLALLQQQQQAAEAAAADPDSAGQGAAAAGLATVQAGAAAAASSGLADDVDQLEVDWEDDD